MRTFNLFPPKRICHEIGSRIKRLRLAQNLTQEQLAQMARGSLSSVRRMETQGQGSFEFMVRIAQALQAVDQLELLFAPPALSISQMEQEQFLATRQRARLSKK